MELNIEDFLKQLIIITKKQVVKYNKYNISNKDFIILMEIYKISQKDQKISTTVIADLFEFTLPAAIKHLKVLEKNNLVKRKTSVDDKRVKYYSINPEVADYLGHVKNENDILKEKFIEKIGKENMVFLGEILNKLIDFAKENI